uniref:KfrA N-terminal DNA-binding domain-containing protein n=1 Tax=Acidithiobacillus caldus TaxID=33059 RepID=Q840R2_9PROT|nr:DNA-binding protein [Acidithiobacillus caldus]AAP04748.1 unknown [Acidithiobacillus caldus]
MEAGPITQQDVAAAADQLGGPANTNAAKIREILGRGSLATIQRHLQALRDAQRAPELPEAVQTIPTPPEAVSEASRGIWAAAWAMAEQRHAESLAHAPCWVITGITFAYSGNGCQSLSPNTTLL